MLTSGTQLLTVHYESLKKFFSYFSFQENAKTSGVKRPFSRLYK